MKLFDVIIMGITVTVARSLRGLLRVYSRFVSPWRDETISPFGKCDKVTGLRNNRTDTRLRDLRGTFPTTSEEVIRRQLMQ
ncbi:MAG: hypothetical protein RL518_2561 [Pseudomonadota bacterium]|jgi:hypothetical protein